MQNSHALVKASQNSMLALFMFGMLTGCAHAQAEPSKQDRNALIGDYSAALSGCDISAFEALIAEDHMGFTVGGSLGSGMDAQALRAQCEAGIKMAVQPVNINWMTETEDSLQIVGFDLVGTLTHPERGTYNNNLRVTLVANAEGTGPLKIMHSHISPLR